MPDGVIPVKLSGVETLKANSRHLRGDLAAELAAPGIQVSEDGYNLLKFHGSYEQFNRDTATARKQRGEEKEYQFMLRVRMPGGRLTAAQYLALDEVAGEFANDSIRITTRQGVQFHGIIKGELKPTIERIDAALLTTQAACGDVVRNVMSTPAPIDDAVHNRLIADARMLSEVLLPKSRAYHQIFLNEETGDGSDEHEPLYGDTYLPRKFKIGIAAPGDNTIDVLTNDLGIIAVWRAEKLVGYNVAVGGGLGMTHNKPNTFPRIADIVGSVGPDELLAVCEAVIRLQRDNGNRSDRRRARLKYVIADRGTAWFLEALTPYLGRPLDPVLDMPPLSVPDHLGWHEQGDGKWWLGVPIASGRIDDTATHRLRTAMRQIMTKFAPTPIMTPQQDMLLADISDADRSAIETVLRDHGVKLREDLSMLERWTLACPALPTCGLALTEAERVRGPLVAQIESALAAHGLADERISLRITGCPNGCARSYAGDIGLVGRVPGSYALYVGGDFEGTRLSFRLHDRLPELQIGAALEPIAAAFARDRQASEGFGDFCNRLGREALLAL